MQTAGAAAVDLLARMGVSHVFGVVGSSTMEMYDALYRHPQVTYIGARDERAAAGMADGWARSNGTLGVVMAGQSGPGVTNLVSGLAAAKAARSPVLSLGGSVSTDHWHRDAFQEVDQESLLRPVTKAVLTVLRPGRVVDTIEHAARIALSHPMGPVHVNLPRDVLMGTVEDSVSRKSYSTLGRAPIELRAVGEALGMLKTASRPVIVAGGGAKASRAGAVIEELSTLLGIPVVTSAGHRDAVSNDHPMVLGQMGPRGGPLAGEVLREADLVLGLGTRFGFNSTFFQSGLIDEDATVIQVDVDPTALGRYRDVDLTVMADTLEFAQHLLDGVRGSSEFSGSEPAWRESVLRRSEERRAVLALPPETSENIPMDDHSFFHALRTAAPRDALYTLDAGTWCLKASEALHHSQTPSLLTPLDFASLGFSFPAAIGAQLALPERPCIALLGDGGALYSLAELSTVKEYDIPVTMIVMNNSAWGAEKAYQRDFYGSRFIGTDLPTHDFASIAEAFGIRSYRVTSVQELQDVLAKTFTERAATVIDVQVDSEILQSFRTDVFARKNTPAAS